MNIHRIKNLRNEIGLSMFLRKHVLELEPCLTQLNRQLHSADTLYISIAFEQPLVLSWQIDLFHRFIKSGTLLVCDNSRNPSKRSEIKTLCLKKNVIYLPLPNNPTQHVNRSHGNAMSWIHHHLIKKLGAVHVAFIDHDLLPIRPWDMGNKLQNQYCYGLRNTGHAPSWSLWAGYCAYQAETVKNMRSNFLYDFSLELDTGGRLWRSYYHKLDARSMIFAHSENISVPNPGTGQTHPVQIIDHSWLHVGGVGYSQNQEQKLAFFSWLRKALIQGESWERLCH